MQAVSLLKAGLQPYFKDYEGGLNRWGDYRIVRPSSAFDGRERGWMRYRAGKSRSGEGQTNICVWDDFRISKIFSASLALMRFGNRFR